jgi:predicted nicotinamide N-methyase
MTTVGVLAWLLSPPIIVAGMGALGFWMYWQAIRGGLTRTRCVLRHPMLVLGYLALASAAGIAGIVVAL